MTARNPLTHIVGLACAIWLFILIRDVLGGGDATVGIVGLVCTTGWFLARLQVDDLNRQLTDLRSFRRRPVPTDTRGEQ